MSRPSGQEHPDSRLFIVFEKECNNKMKELKEATGLAAATSFKHVSPVAVPLTKDEKKKWLGKLTCVASGSDAFSHLVIT